MIKRIACLVSLALLACATALAQDVPKTDIYLGYSYARISPETSGVGAFNMNGGSASVSWNFHRHVGFVADFGGYTGSLNVPVILNSVRTNGSQNPAALALAPSTVKLTGQIYTYMFGPRFTYRNSENSQKVTPFVQVLFGGAHASANLLGSSTSLNSFAMTAGGGLDVRLADHFSWRMVQAEYFLTRFNEGGVATGGSGLNQHNARISTGIVFQF